MRVQCPLYSLAYWAYCVLFCSLGGHSSYRCGLCNWCARQPLGLGFIARQMTRYHWRSMDDSFCLPLHRMSELQTGLIREMSQSPPSCCIASQLIGQWSSCLNGGPGSTLSSYPMHIYYQLAKWHVAGQKLAGVRTTFCRWYFNDDVVMCTALLLRGTSFYCAENWINQKSGNAYFAILLRDLPTIIWDYWGLV